MASNWTCYLCGQSIEIKGAYLTIEYHGGVEQKPHWDCGEMLFHPECFQTVAGSAYLWELKNSYETYTPIRPTESLAVNYYDEAMQSIEQAKKKV